MGSQTLEILRQGVWASLTGGWFYDPHQDVFCNTFHLYIWLFLLCLPFIIYLYFPPTGVVWLAYCGVILTVFLVLKLANLWLHHMYDTSECVTEAVDEVEMSEIRRALPPGHRKPRRGEEVGGIEMQVLKGTPPVQCSSRNSLQESLPSSRTSREDFKVAGVIDLKADVHRKNSSESSEEALPLPLAFHGPMIVEQASVHRAESYTQRDHERFRERLLENRHKQLRQRHDDQRHDDGPRARRLSARAANADISFPGGLPGAGAPPLKPTSSLELGCMQVPPGYMHWKQHGPWCQRRLPDGSGSHGDAGHLAPYYCSEIVYPIAETSDEMAALDGAPPFSMQSSRGDSGEEGGSRSPLLVRRESCESKPMASSSLDHIDIEASYRDVFLKHFPPAPAEVTVLEVESAPLEMAPLDADPPITSQGSAEAAEAEEAAAAIDNTDDVDGGGAASTSLMGLDWLFEHTDSESSMLEPPLWNYTRSDDSDFIVDTMPNAAKDNESSSSSATLSLEHEVMKLLPAPTPLDPLSAPTQPLVGCQGDASLRNQGAIPKRRAPLEDSTGPGLVRGQPERRRRRLVRDASAVDRRGDADATSIYVTMKPASLPGADRLSLSGTLGSERHGLGTNGGSDRHSLNGNGNGVSDRLGGSGTGSDRMMSLSGTGSDRNNICTTTGSAGKPEEKEAASSSGSNTELSSLLPPPAPPLLHALMATRSRDNADRSSRSRHRRLKRSGRAHRLPAGGPGSLPATHLAATHDDTTQGAVHCFRDETGNWLSYTFDEKGSGAVNGGAVNNGKLLSTLLRHGQPSDDWPRMAHDDDKMVEDSWSFSPNKMVAPMLDSPPPSAFHLLSDSLGEHNHRHIHANASAILLCAGEQSGLQGVVGLGPGPGGLGDPDQVQRPRFRFLDSPGTVQETPGASTALQPRSYHLLSVSPCLKMKVRLDRLALLALLDRNPTAREALLGATLALLVAALGGQMLQRGMFRDAAAFLFCFVLAGCQYSLLKSVQPDASSPTHGFNRLAAFSRPVYFCVVASAALLVEGQARDWLTGFLLCFPLVFSLGLLPQVNTFAMYLLEQTETHVFGGGAAAGLGAALYCVVRSVVAVTATLGFAYGALLEPRASQHFLFSVFCGLTVATAYHLSRSASDPSALWQIVVAHLAYEPPSTADCSESGVADGDEKDGADPLPRKLRQTVNARIKSDAIVCTALAAVVTGIHASTVFTVLQPEVVPALCGVASLLGVTLHYVAPQLRKQLPWLCLARPVLRAHEHGQYEVHAPARVMWFEKAYVWLCLLERNLVYPCLYVAAMTGDAPRLAASLGPLPAALLVAVCGLKALRIGFSEPGAAAMTAAAAALLFTSDFPGLGQGFLVDSAIVAVLVSKTRELLLKVQFVVTYIAPWQITWGSAFHAFAQPFSVPHSAMLFAQALLSAALSAPLNPFLGSAVFLASYVRPVRFWERDYNTRRVDHSNTRLSAHLERNLGADDNNLNSIFYEHLTRSLQHSLCGDLMMGRWGPVSQGDVFVLASDYLNCLVHVVELANGLVSFQLRGLEFRGTYCQQREVEAISEWVEENEGCCCCEAGHPPHLLSVNAAFSQRWLAWEVTATKYVLEGYSISDNSAVSMLQVFDFRKVLISYYVKSMIFYCVGSPRLEAWLTSAPILAALAPTLDKAFVELDPVFNMNVDEDFDFRAAGVTRSSFCNVYLDWLQYCAVQAGKGGAPKDGPLVSLCLALSLLGRRALGSASHNAAGSVEFFLYGLHALFKGDFRITSPRDEWVFSDVELLRTVVARGVRMSLKLHQDHFSSPDEYEEHSALHDAIARHSTSLVISHEGDPAWRAAVLAGTPSLLALRHVVDDGADEYKVIMLNKRQLSFRVIKVNRECVRGLWAGQQQELVYLRNRNPERGSIQNAKQALRNIINSSCDQPIGYPIYVSPLTTSYAETNEQLCAVVGGALSLGGLKRAGLRLWQRARRRCAQGCSSGGGAARSEEGGFGGEGVYAMTQMAPPPSSGSQSLDGLTRPATNRSSLASSMSKPGSGTLASLAGLLGNDKSQEEEPAPQRVRIVDPTAVYDAINLGRRIDVSWPDERMRTRGGRSHWRDWLPEKGMEGQVVHRWVPSHRDPGRRSHVDRAILLVKIDDKFVPIAESAVQDLGAEV